MATERAFYRIDLPSKYDLTSLPGALGAVGVGSVVSAFVMDQGASWVAYLAIDKGADEAIVAPGRYFWPCEIEIGEFYEAITSRQRSAYPSFDLVALQHATAGVTSVGVAAAARTGPLFLLAEDELGLDHGGEELPQLGMKLARIFIPKRDREELIGYLVDGYSEALDRNGGNLGLARRAFYKDLGATVYRLWRYEVAGVIRIIIEILLR